MKLRILSEADVHKALPMSVAIDVMRRAFGQLSAKQAELPLRTRLQTDKGLMLLMPAFMQESRELAFKMVSIWGDNPSKGLPAVVAIAAVIDPDTGMPLALVNGEALTGIRTGAGGGLAAELLSREDSKIVTVFGAGVQARAQLEAVMVVRDIEEVRIVSRSREPLEAFAAEVEAWDGDHRVVLPDSAQTAVQGADIVIAATTSETPVFDGNDLKAGAHVTGVGSYSANMQEVDLTTVTRAKIVVDSRVASLAEAGDLVIPIQQGRLSTDDIHAELGEIVNGDKPGRQSADEITFFKSVGVAVQDATAATQILREAEAQGLGTVVEL